jgi:hypothetical protein
LESSLEVAIKLLLLLISDLLLLLLLLLCLRGLSCWLELKGLLLLLLLLLSLLGLGLIGWDKSWLLDCCGLSSSCRWSENRRRWLLNRTSSSHGLNLLYLKLLSWFLLVFLTESLVFFIDIHNEFLYMIACNLILIKVTGTYAQMQWLVTFFLSWTFLKARPFASKPKFNNLLELIIGRAFTANFNNPFHVTPFCSYKSSSYLEFLIIIYLYIESAGILDIFVLHLIG